MKKTIQNILIALSILLILIAGFLCYVSPQKTALFTDIEGNLLKNSIAEIRNIEINGITQRILIRGENKDNPILLHIHGGPGGPEHPFIKHSKADLEDIFTVCYWEQRGAGASYSNDIPANTITLNQLVADGIEVSKYLINNFKKEKIYVQGHSWGTVIGSHLVHRTPELFHAYIGIGQMANTRLSEQRSFDYTRQKAEKAKDQKSVVELDKIGRPPYKTDAEWLKNVMIERGIMRKYEKPDGKNSMNMMDIYKVFIFYPEYSIKDKLNALSGADLSMNLLWNEAIELNLFESIPEQFIPIYIIQGQYDKHTVSSVAKEYLEVLKAPKKKYYNFENSGHDPHFDEFEKYKAIIVEEVLRKKG